MKKDGIILAFFLFTTVILRFSAFFQSVIDWDESLYLLVARGFINGEPPYTGIWDNKPLGIYLLYSLSILLLGNSVLAIRILSCIAVTLTCYLLYRLGNTIGKTGSWLGLFAGVLYAIYSLNNSGLAANTELFFIPCVVLGFYLVLSNKSYPETFLNRNSIKFLTIGMIMGIGLQIKYVVLYDFMALLIIVASQLFFQFQESRKRFLFKLTVCYTWLILGFILPSLGIILYYVINGHLNDYIYANFTANIINSTSSSFLLFHFLSVLRDRMAGDPFIWLCLFLAPVYLIFFRDTYEDKKNLVYLLLWFSMSFLAVCYTKRFHGHYFLQLLPSLCLISAYLIDKILLTRSELTFKKIIISLILIIIAPLSILKTSYPSLVNSKNFIYFRYIKNIRNWGDTPSQVAKYIQPRIYQNDYIYVVNYEPIIYFLVKAKIPTKYAFPLFLIDKHYSKVANTQPINELESILQKKPVYVILDSTKAGMGLFYTELYNHLQRDYILEHAIENVKLYRLKS